MQVDSSRPAAQGPGPGADGPAAEEKCEKCGTDKYWKPDLKLMVSTCLHRLYVFLFLSSPLFFSFRWRPQ
jgi:hypothetical protein